MKLSSILFVLFLTLCSVVVAQPVDPCPNPPCDPDAVPISGIELLLGAGALFGAKRLLDKRRK
jgi:hypothetical protein